ncbi:MAG: hypothetical protein HZA52_14255 [Planctomycetes bacterium]|nr:hypothetical protein [Planctomycetota bacterium]
MQYRRDALAKELEALQAETLASARVAHERVARAATIAGELEGEVLQQSLRNVEFARRAYELGDTTVLVWLECRRRASEARRAAVEARWDFARAVIELERALGRPLDSLGPARRREDRP